VSAQHPRDAEQSASDADQAASDADQTAADLDQAAAAADQTDADNDQAASDRDQATADREHAGGQHPTDDGDDAYEASRHERQAGALDRLGNRLRRAHTAQDRDAMADQRDQTAAERDAIAQQRASDATEPKGPESDAEASLRRQLEELNSTIEADRQRAAADRARAAQDRAVAARERARLEAELRLAHLDDLTGAYRREMGELALHNEIDRARRLDGRFVVAFVDVDNLKDVNDMEGHAAGDRVLQIVVRTMRARLRSFDPVIRYGGDEFVCGLGGADLAEAERRFAGIAAAVHSEIGVGISVGLASLEDGETAEELTERADAAMLYVKAQHHEAA
jgi:diguanylate cyclase (GGDEF)-like protein